MLKYNNKKIKAKIHLVSKVCPRKPVGEKGEGRKGEKRKERREKWKKIVEQGGRRDFFFFSFKLSKCSSSGSKGEEPKETKNK